MLSRFFSCRERFRLKYILGLEPYDKWNHRLGYGNMWHACEEGHACKKEEHSDGKEWLYALNKHVNPLIDKYPMQRDEILKWHAVCYTQFPEYVKYWAEHPDVVGRTPLLQEEAFDVPYELPSGRVVRLRGKWDSVDMIEAHTDEQGIYWPRGIYLQENKTKGDIDKLQVERQLKFDLQTMLYLIALQEWCEDNQPDGPLLGVRYNVVRRPLSGGWGTISPHKEKTPKKGKYVPAETAEQFYERLRKDYLEAKPDHWFFRVRAEVSQRDMEVFCDTCLDPLLETLCWWYEEITKRITEPVTVSTPFFSYRTPFGVYSALEEGGATEYDAYLDSGSEAGLRRVTELFPELK